MLLAGRRFATLCQDLFALAQVGPDQSGPARGYEWERQIADHLARKGFPAEPVPGGVRVFGAVPASGLRHQTDSAIDCVDAHVIGEWKAYRTPVHKNELLRFKAATDDLYESLVEHRPRLPVLRLFGIAGDAYPELRWYAARHGISLIERSRWPAPVLADGSFPWKGFGPSFADRARLNWLSRPLQRVYPRQPDGSLRLPRRLPEPAVSSLLELHDRWSDRAWDLIDAHAGMFEDHIAELVA